MKIFLFLIIIFILIIFLLILKPLSATVKVLLLISEEFPQIPIKPLHLITTPPKTEKVKIELNDNTVIGDLFVPSKKGTYPTLVIGMGVKTSKKDRSTILHFCDTLSRLGYVVFWPRREILEKDINDLEEPQTFIESVYYLRKRNEVDKKRISFVGLSVGSSIMLTAAEHPKINDKIRSLVFFGGYFNIFDYLSSIFTKTVVVNGQKISWIPAESATSHIEDILSHKGLTKEEINSPTRSDEITKLMLNFSPDQNLDKLKAELFVLHEKADSFVPYVESEKLKEAFEKQGQQPKAFHIANLFEHVQPKKGFSPQILKEFLGLSAFLHKLFMYL